MNIVKRFLVCFLTTLIIVLLTGCKDGGQSEIEYDYEEKVIVEGWMQGFIQHLSINSETLFFTTFYMSGEQNGEESSYNGLYGISDNDEKPVEIPHGLDEEYQHVIVSDIMCDNEMISLWLSTCDQDEYEPVNVLVQMDLDYNIINKVDLNKSLNEENIYKVLHSSNGYYICMGKNKLYIIDKNMELANTLELDGNAVGIAFTNEEKVLCLISNNDDMKSLIFDLDKMSVEKEIPIKSCYADCLYGIISGNSYDFNYRTDEGIYGYSIDEQKSMCIFSFDRFGISGEEIRDVLCDDTGDIIFSINSDEGSQIVRYTRNDNPKKKTKIILGVLQADSQIRKAVQYFNKNDAEYNIEIKEYYNEDEGDTPDDAIRKLNEDIAKGSVPDILDLSLLSYRYEAKGLYEDLTSYIGNSENLDEDEFFENAIAALKENDKLYTVSPGFGIMTLVCKKSECEAYEDLNIEKLENISKEMTGNNVLLVSSSKEDLLSILLDGNLGDFYDWETGECQFDSEEFKKLLEYCDEMEYDNYHDTNKIELIQQNTMPLIPGISLIPGDVAEYRKILGEEIQYVGYPNKDGSNNYFVFENQIGIYSNSKQKEGAWKFIEMILSYDYQKHFVDIYSDDALIPLRKDCYNEVLDSMMKSKEIQLSAEEKVDFDKLLDSTRKSSSYDIVMLQIINEEAQEFFNKKRSVDETVKLIQTRCETYMNETR